MHTGETCARAPDSCQYYECNPDNGEVRIMHTQLGEDVLVVVVVAAPLDVYLLMLKSNPSTNTPTAHEVT